MRKISRVLPVILPMVAIALTVSACGDRTDDRSSGSGDQPTTSSTPSPSASTSSAAKPVSCKAPLAWKVDADLDGDGKPDAVQYAASCGFSTDVAGKPAALNLGAVRLSDASPQVVTIPGRTGQVIVARQEHPRGGYQIHLYGYADGKLGEITAGGKAIVPFVATDTRQGTPVTAGCADGGIAVVEARAHTPVGVAFAWDVFSRTYKVDGNQATEGAEKKVAANVLPDNLGTKFPPVAKNRMFTNCTRPGLTPVS